MPGLLPQETMGGTPVLYGLLGDVDIGHGGRLLDLPGRHSRIVFAALLVNANRPLSKVELMRVAWGDAEVAEAQLHKAVQHVRTMLERTGHRDDLITHARQGYELRVAENDLDMLVFHRLLRQADEAAAGRRVGDEIDRLRAALRLWRGPRALANVPGDVFQREAVGLQQRRKRAAVRLFDLELARGGHHGILDELTTVAGYHPEDRRLCEQLMIVQYRCGHAGDALEAYERHDAAVAEQLATAPDPALRALYYAIGGGDEAAVAAAEAAVAHRVGSAAQAPTAAVVPRQLPPDPPGFVGRGDLVAEATWLLGRHRERLTPTIVITGPGGIGKTALARRVARLVSERYPDGQLYVELRATADEVLDPGEVLAQLLRAFGVTTVPESTAERLMSYRTLLADRRVLLVLDDVHDGAQIADLIPANPGCGVLVTARRRLPDLSGAHHLPPLEPLAHDAARELFLYQVGSAGIDLRADPEGVDRVVELCGGLPLALRVAAALRVHDHPQPTAELADRLSRHGPEAFTYGEQSVALTIATGFDRLHPDARQLFLRLGQLRLPQFGLWTSAVLLDGTGVDPAAALSQLAASSMLDLSEAQVRYRFHDLTRDYADRRATGSGVQARHEEVYRALLTLTRRAHARLYGGPFEVVHSAVPDWDAPAAALAEVDASPLDWLERERRNIRAAVNHCAELGLTQLCWDLAVSAHEFYTVRGYFDDWYATHAVALRACRDAGDRRGEGIVLACLGQPALVASRRAGVVSGLSELERAVDLLAECGERHGQAIAMRTLGNALRRRGHLGRPLALFTEALGHYEASGDTVGRCQTLRFIGQTHLDLGNHTAALGVLRAAEDVGARLGEPRLVAQTSYWIGQVQLAQGDLTGAEQAFNSVLDAFRRPAGVGHAYAVHGLGEVAQRSGALRDAEQYLATAAELAGAGADAVLEGRVCLSVADLDAMLGRPDRQISALERAVSCFTACGAAYLQVQALAALSRAHADRADGAAARAAWSRVEFLYEEMELPEADRIHRAAPGAAW